MTLARPRRPPTQSKVPVEENIVTEALTKAPTKNEIVDTTEQDEASKSKAPKEENIATEVLTEAPTENEAIELLESTEETVKSKLPLEQQTVPKALIGVEKAKEAKKAK